MEVFGCFRDVAVIDLASWLQQTLGLNGPTNGEGFSGPDACLLFQITNSFTEVFNHC